MKQEIDKELINMFANPLNINGNMHLLIEVDRHQIIQDTLNSLVRDDINYRKPLKVKFINELGVDEGGV